MPHVREVASAERPNILFILADDLGWGDVGFHGSRIATPNLDRLARTGTELVQHYVCPVCTPTRTAFMTGRHPSRFGLHATAPSNEPVMPDGYVSVAEMLRRAGYETALFGKWHLGSDTRHYPNNWGFESSYGSLAGGVDPYTHRYKTGEYSDTWHENGIPLPEQGHVTDLITNRAIDWLEQRDGERPWFCYIPFTAVHTPIKPPERWMDHYEGTIWDADPENHESFQRYAAYTSHMDEAVGRLLETLKRIDQYHNTLVVFTSDNGATTNSIADVMLYPGWQDECPLLGSNRPLRGKKTQVYEGGIRTPTLVRLPGVVPADRRCRAVLHVADWMPTFARVAQCELEHDPCWDGTDIWPVLVGERPTPPERSLYWNVRDRRRAVRRGPWKLIELREEAGTPTYELYHIEADPQETIELSTAMPDEVAALQRELAAFTESDGIAKRDDVD